MTTDTAQNKASVSAAPAVLGWLTFLFLETLVILQAILAHHDQFLTVTEMHEKGIAKGLPFIWHFGMLGDVLIVSPLGALIAGRCGSQWDWRTIFRTLFLAAIITVAFGWFWSFSLTPEAHVQNHRVTTVGIIHLIYMAIALCIFLMFFFHTAMISPFWLWMTTVLLILHLFMETHMALGLINLVTPLDWYPDQPLKNVGGWATLAVAAIGMIWRASVIISRSERSA